MNRSVLLKPSLLAAVAFSVCLTAACKAADDGRSPNAAAKIRAERMERLERLKMVPDPRTSRLVSELFEQTNAELKNVPLRKALAKLADPERITIVLDVHADSRQTVTRRGARKRLHEVLDELCAQAKLDWDTYGQVVFIGRSEAVSKFRRLSSVRSARRMRAPDRLADQLKGPTELHFRDEPLSGVLEFIGDLHMVPVALGSEPVLRRLLVTFSARAIPLDVALDLLCATYGCEWGISADGKIHVRPETRRL